MLQPTTKFAEFPYRRPSFEELESKTTAIVTTLAAASTTAEKIAAIDAWNAQRTEYDTFASIAHVHYTQDVANESYRAEKSYFDEIGPKVADLNINVSKAILALSDIDALKHHYGALFFTSLESSLKTFSPAIIDLLLKETKTLQRYTDMMASAMVEFRGEKYNLSQLGKFGVSTDRATRREAAEASWSFFAEKKDEMDGIYDELVGIRTEIAHTLGFSSYTDYRYLALSRFGYTPKDVEAFRKQIRESIVPLVQSYREQQRERLGLEKLTFIDEALQFADGNPTPQGSPEWIREQATTMYRELSPVTHEFYSMMEERELLDLVARNNKSGGGYCTSFPLFQVPFIFSNFNGTTHDVEVLTHEAGHALQAWLSAKFDVPEYRWPTYEACEIHSMGMEFLTWPWMDLFFGEQAEKFRTYHLQGALIFLPYAAAVDEFQHWVYANPTASPEARRAQWLELEKVYLPWRDYDGLPYVSEGAVWQRQAHIYASPFYYIDYALAQTCALQIWQRSQTDRESVLRDYLHICAVGGSLEFRDIVKAANLKDPFTPGTLEGIAVAANEWLRQRAEFSSIDA